MNDWGKYETSMKEISEQPVKVNNTSLVKKTCKLHITLFRIILGILQMGVTHYINTL